MCTGSVGGRWHDRAVPRPPARRARRTRRGARAAAMWLVLALAAGLVACTSSVPGAAVPASSAAVPVSSASGPSASGGVSTAPRSSAQGSPAPVRAGLEEYYAQDLDWGSARSWPPLRRTSSTAQRYCSARI